MKFGQPNAEIAKVSQKEAKKKPTAFWFLLSFEFFAFSAKPLRPLRPAVRFLEPLHG